MMQINGNDRHNPVKVVCLSRQMINGKHQTHFAPIPLSGCSLRQAGFDYNGAVYTLRAGNATISIDLKRRDWIVIDDHQGGQIILHRKLDFLHEVQNLVRELAGCDLAVIL